MHRHRIALLQIAITALLFISNYALAQSGGSCPTLFTCTDTCTVAANNQPVAWEMMQTIPSQPNNKPNFWFTGASSNFICLGNSHCSLGYTGQSTCYYTVTYPNGIYNIQVVSNAAMRPSGPNWHYVSKNMTHSCRNGVAGQPEKCTFNQIF